MATNPYLDLDAAFAEQEFNKNPLVVRFNGRDWEFPGTMPAMALVRLARWEASGRVHTVGEGQVSTGDLTVGEQIALVSDLIPDQHLVELSRLGVGLDDPRLERLVEWLLAEYMLRIKQEPEEELTTPNPTEAVTVSSSSSETGDLLLPTSNENTVSPFQRT